MSEVVAERTEVERAALVLLDAMDRQYGAPLFSQRVHEARNALALLVRHDESRDPADESREA